jgi:glutamate dehydrogenase (NAD(P)+)
MYAFDDEFEPEKAVEKYDPKTKTHGIFGPEKIMEVYDPKTKVHGVVVIHNTALGPGKGGIRMVSDISTQEVYGLARAMTWKNALANLPYGGAKAGIKADPKTVNKEEVMRAFARMLKPIIPAYYIAGPDMNISEKEMGYFADELKDMKACTGKPASMGGLPHELGSTGFGVVQATKVAMEYSKRPLSGASVALEGYGNVGTFTHKFITGLGAKVVAISDSKGTAYVPGGLDYEKAMEVKAGKGTITAYPGAKIMPAAALFGMSTDILIPGARPNVITRANVDAVRARLVVEAANIPMTPEIEGVLSERGVVVVPDFVANAGGVISSYVEHIGGTPQEMFRIVEEKISSNTKIVMERSGGKDVRKAAMAIAMERVREAMERRG